jgi:hypothetical protein
VYAFPLTFCCKPTRIYHLWSTRLDHASSAPLLVVPSLSVGDCGRFVSWRKSNTRGAPVCDQLLFNFAPALRFPTFWLVNHSSLAARGPSSTLRARIFQWWQRRLSVFPAVATSDSCFPWYECANSREKGGTCERRGQAAFIAFFSYVCILGIVGRPLTIASALRPRPLRRSCSSILDRLESSAAPSHGEHFSCCPPWRLLCQRCFCGHLVLQL